MTFLTGDASPWDLDALLANRSLVKRPGVSSIAPTVRHVTNRVGIANQISGSNTQIQARCWQISYEPISAIKVGFANWYVSSVTSGVETGCGSDCTVFMSLEYPRGTFTRLTWAGGATSGTVTNGTTGETDLVALGFTIPAFAWFRIAAFATWTGAGRR